MPIMCIYICRLDKLRKVRQKLHETCISGILSFPMRNIMYSFGQVETSEQLSSALSK